jgi:hypothetical protein
VAESPTRLKSTDASAGERLLAICTPFAALAEFFREALRFGLTEELREPDVCGSVLRKSWNALTERVMRTIAISASLTIRRFWGLVSIILSFLPRRISASPEVTAVTQRGQAATKPGPSVPGA